MKQRNRDTHRYDIDAKRKTPAERVRMIIAMIVVFVTVYTLIMPAIAIEKKSAADMPGLDAGADGTSGSYELSCPFVVHEHTDACYEEQDVLDAYGNPTGEKQKVLICGKADWVVHEHDAGCYQDGVLVCTLPEIKAHQHDKKCYEAQQVLTCQLPETDGHQHVDGCYSESQELTCTIPEHTHSGACYSDVVVSSNEVLTCGYDEGEVISPAEYSDAVTDEETDEVIEEPQLIREEVVHHHDSSCYRTEEQTKRQLTCGMEEHTHSDACYRTDRTLVCGLEETPGHHHTDACYTEQKVPVCGEIEPHTHTIECYEKGPEDESPEEMGWVSYTEDERGNRVLTGDPKHLICGKPELLVHQHGAECFRTVENAAEEEGEIIAEGAGGNSDENAGDPDSAGLTGAENAAAGAGEGETADGNGRDGWIYLNADDEADQKEADEQKTDGQEADGQEVPAEPFNRTAEVEVDGAPYTLIVQFTDESGLPENAIFKAVALTEEQENYQAYQDKAFSSVEECANEGENGHSRAEKMLGLFDITIFDEDGNVIEPSAPISVTVNFGEEIDTNENGGIYAVHFPGTGLQKDEKLMPADDGQKGQEGQTQEGDPEEQKGNDAEVTAEALMEMLTEQLRESGLFTESAKIANTDVEVIETSVENGQEITFEAGGFSVYAVVYTVDFHWEVNGKMYEFSMPGGGFVSFEHLVEVLGIAGDTNIAVTENRNETEADDSDDAAETQGVVTQNETDEEENQDNSASLSFEDVEISENTRKFVEDVESITFSSPELLSVSKVEEDTTVKDIIDELKLEIIYSQELGWNQIEKIRALEVKAGDWALIALKPFQTNETLTVTMKNGEEFVISVTDYAQYSPVENDGVNIPNPNGTVMNLFDYWVDKDLKDNTGKNAWPGYSNGMYNPASWGDKQVAGYGNNRGINSWSEDTAHGHALKFNPSDQYTVFDGTYGNWQQRNVNGQRRINSWVGNADPLQGLVLPELVNGYPKLTNNSSLGTNGESLAYLFDGTEGEDMGKKVYSGVDGLLYVDQDGYYTYDSRDFAATYNSGTNRFALSRFADNVSGGPRGFWPFGSEKFWVGLHMKVDFSMPTNGQVLNPNGEYKDMTFSFSGDDDTWIYVDGILVGDGGGVHNRTQIDINFRTGTVHVTGKNDPDYTGSFESTQYLDDLIGAYNNDGTYDTEKWEPYLDANGNQVLHTSGSNNGRPVLVFKSGSHHDLQMFYMERGGGFSNLMIHYNLISTTDMSAHKSYHNTDGSRLHRNDYRFELIGYDNTAYSGEAAKAIMPDSKIYDSTKELGTFENPEQYHVAASEGQPGYSYVKLGATEDGNVNFGNLREFSVADLGKEYRYVVREWVPPTAENEDHIQWQNATDEQKAEGGFVYGGITYDSRIYYFIGRVEETEEGSGVYELKKYRYLDPDYTIPDTETKFFSFVNGKELPLTLRINKQDDEDNPLSGAKFSLTRALQEEGKWVRRHWTDTTGAEPEEKYSELRNATTVQGALTFNNLKEGHYILEETEPPAGYEKGNVYRWLLTLTKEDSAAEIVLVPTIQALDADGNVIDTVPVEELEVENHTAEFDVLNTPVPPFTITVNKSWLGANNEPLEQSEFSEYTAKFKLHRLRTYTTPGKCRYRR